MEDTIVGRIFDLMHEKGITQKQIADKLGIKQGTVAGWKQRNCPPPINYNAITAIKMSKSYFPFQSYTFVLSYIISSITRIQVTNSTRPPSVISSIIPHLVHKIRYNQHQITLNNAVFTLSPN